jgi:hypothetical protein
MQQTSLNPYHTPAIFQARRDARQGRVRKIPKEIRMKNEPDK